MNTAISKILSNLERQASIERSAMIHINPQDKIQAITADTGMFFNILLKSIKATRILEVGTSAGYSTLWFADAVLMNYEKNLQIKKPIVTIEKDHSKVEKAMRNFEAAKVFDKIDIIEGEAKTVLSAMQVEASRNKDTPNEFDFVFLDADKENLVKYFDMVLPMVRKNGIIAADNMCYPEDYRIPITNYVRYLRKKPNIQSVTLPIGNGEEITIKL